MNLKIQQINKQDLFWFIGYFVGDGYVTTGRIGMDTTSSDIANRALAILQKMNDKVKIKIYGEPKTFSSLPVTNLLYSKKKPTHSDHVKIRIDDTDFMRSFVELKDMYISNVSDNLIGDFLQGFFDAEATVSPIGQIEVDMSKKQ